MVESLPTSETLVTQRLLSLYEPTPLVDLEDLNLNVEIPTHLEEGFAVRAKNFSSEVSFYAPSVKRYETDEFSNCSTCSFTGLSITGDKCALNCDHCQAEVLKGMPAALTPESMWTQAKKKQALGSGGLLISGGSNKKNVVPMQRYFKIMKRIKDELGMRLLVHVAFADEALAEGLAEVGVDSVMLDIIGDNDTIHEVYHLPNASTHDYRRTLRNLSAMDLPLSPHVVIGLHYGEVRGEVEALHIIRDFNISSLVLVALQPMVGTPMEHVTPATPEAIGEICGTARLMFPHTNILLGCERPHGYHKIATDQLALKAGVNGIAYPAEGIIGLAQAMGLKTNLSAMCCSLNFQGV